MPVPVSALRPAAMRAILSASLSASVSSSEPRPRCSASSVRWRRARIWSRSVACWPWSSTTVSVSVDRSLLV
jgi:hypothetical protein